MQEILLRKIEQNSIEEILLDKGYYVKKEEDIYKVSLKEYSDLELFMILEGETLFIQLDLISLNEIKNDINFYKKVLDMNTEILPVSMAIDSTDQEDQRLVINESLAVETLDENELLKVLDVIELNLVKIYTLIKEYKK